MIDLMVSSLCGSETLTIKHHLFSTLTVLKWSFNYTREVYKPVQKQFHMHISERNSNNAQLPQETCKPVAYVSANHYLKSCEPQKASTVVSQP